MQELIEKLQAQFGLSAEQCHGILATIKNFVTEKFPMAAGMLDNILPAGGNQTPAGDTGTTEGPAEKGGSFLDKISDVIPGEMGEKAENFAKDKLGGIV